MKNLLLLLLLIALQPLPLLAQETYYPRDTSYSIHSYTEKIARDYPFVRPVWPELPRKVEAHYNLVYAELGEDRQLHLDLFRPKRRRHKKRPAVLMIHGGGWGAGSKENVVPMAQQLARRGYVTVAVEYRLSGEAPYPAGVQDLKAAVRWMRAQAEVYGIDTTRIAAYGCSAGAHLASLLGTTNELTLFDAHPAKQEHSASVQAVLNIDGIVSFIHPEAEPEWTGYSANRWLDSLSTHYERWQEASPLEYAGADTPPFLFVNSSRPRFHAGRDDLTAILSEHNTYFEVHTLEDSPHGFWLADPWFDPTLKLSLAFLKEVFD